jgi:hypothetical protein
MYRALRTVHFFGDEPVNRYYRFKTQRKLKGIYGFKSRRKNPLIPILQVA